MDLEFSLSGTEKRVLIAFVLVSLLFSHWMVANSNSRLDLTRAMVEDKSLDISQYSNNTVDRVRFNGEVYSDKAPGASILATPIYASFKAFEGFLPAEQGAPEYVTLKETAPWTKDRPGTRFAVDRPLSDLVLRTLLVFFLSTLPSAATLLLMYRILGRHGFSRMIKAVTTFIFGFGTVILFYSTTFMANTLAMFFGFFSFYLVETEDISRKKTLLAGVSGGLAGLMEYYALIIPVFLGFYLIWQRIESLEDLKTLSYDRFKYVASYMAGALTGLLPLFIYNSLTTGNPLLPLKTTGDWVPLSAIKILNAGSSFWIKIPGFMISDGIPGVVISDGTPGMIFRILFGLERGLFVYSPFLFLALPGLYILYRGRKKLSVTLGGMLSAFVLFNATFIAWYGGAAFGPRYLVPLIPFLSIPFAYTLESFWDQRAFKVLLAIIFTISIVIAFLGFNGVGLHPTDPMEGQQSYEDVYSTTYEELTGLEVFLNPLPDYAASFSEKGATSNWVDVLSGSPDTNLHYVFDSNEHLAGIAVAGKILVLKSRFLEESLIAAIFLLVWRRPLFNKLGLEYPWSKALIFFLMVMLLLSNLGTVSGFAEEGWYEKDGRGMFMSERASYVINTPSEGFLVADITPIRSENMALNVSLEGKNREISLKGREKVIFPVKRGLKQVMFKSDCERMYRLKNDSSDLRCISVSMNGMEFKTFDEVKDKEGVVYSHNWLPGANGTSWISENSRLWLKPEKNFIKAKINAVDPKRERRILIYRHRSLVENTTVSRTQKLTLPVERGDMTELAFRSPEECSTPANLFPDSKDDRCLSFRLHSIESNLVEYGKGWYSWETADCKKWRWMDGEASANLYTGEPEQVNLSFSIIPFKKDRMQRTAEIGVNEQTIFEGKIYGSEKQIESEVELKKGLNQVKFYSGEPCGVPAETAADSNDTRCLSYRITPIQVDRVDEGR